MWRGRRLAQSLSRSLHRTLVSAHRHTPRVVQATRREMATTINTTRATIDPVTFSIPRAGVAGAFDHAGSATEGDTSDVVAELIALDAFDHHVFFNEKGFHNHLIHVILADYSLGASVARLRDLYERKKEQTLPIKGPRSILPDFEWNATRCLGNQDYYQSYLYFFQDEIHRLGIKATVERYIFANEVQMLERFVGGAYHPMIQTGYGVEFDIPMMVAEGLAQTAVHKPSPQALFPGDSLTRRADEASAAGEVADSDRCRSEDETALQIALRARTDSRFDELVSFNDSPKFQQFLKKSAAPPLVLEYVEAWNLSYTSKACLLQKAGELQALAAAAYGGAQRPSKATKLDFFLMHALTSSLFLPCLVNLLEPRSGIMLLHAKLASDLAYYISRGRPALDLAQFAREADAARPWPDIYRDAVAHDDEHVPKAVRAIHHAERYDSDAELCRLSGTEAIYRLLAELTLEGDGEWDSDGPFDEMWQEVPDLRGPRFRRAAKGAVGTSKV